MLGLVVWEGEKSFRVIWLERWGYGMLFSLEGGHYMVLLALWEEVEWKTSWKNNFSMSTELRFFKNLFLCIYASTSLV